MGYLKMGRRKRTLRGSPARDAFKQWHKLLFCDLYACDADFILVEKNPPGIVAVIDYKAPGDIVTFSETLAYNAFLECGVNVYIVIGEAPFDDLEIYAYLGGDSVPEPPVVDLELIHVTHSKLEFARWEKQLRQDWRNGN